MVTGLLDEGHALDAFVRRRTGLQTQLREDFLDHRLLQDGRDDLQLAAAVRAVLQVKFKDAIDRSFGQRIS